MSWRMTRSLLWEDSRLHAVLYVPAVSGHSPVLYDTTIRTVAPRPLYAGGKMHALARLLLAALVLQSLYVTSCTAGGT
jgi:hypothetical protein